MTEMSQPGMDYNFSSFAGLTLAFVVVDSVYSVFCGSKGL